MLNEAIHDLAYAWGGPPARGRLRQNPEDFAVREIPLLEPAGTGEHVWLWIAMPVFIRGRSVLPA